MVDELDPLESIAVLGEEPLRAAGDVRVEAAGEAAVARDDDDLGGALDARGEERVGDHLVRRGPRRDAA